MPSRQVGLFWDVTKEPLPDIVETHGFKPFLTPTAIACIAIAVLLYILIILILIALGLSFVPTVLSFLAIGIGCVCIAVLLGQQYRMGAVVDALSNTSKSLEAARSQQSEIGKKYFALQTNFTSIVEEATERMKSAERSFELKSRTIEAAYSERSVNLQSECSAQRQAAASAVQIMVNKLLAETQSFLIAKLTTNNFSQSMDRYRKMVEYCTKSGGDVPSEKISGFEQALREEFESLVRKQAAREEQARIKEKIREEQRVEQEIEREMKRAETERRILEEKLADAIAKAHGEVNDTIEELKRRLEEAESRQRAISMAQQTKAGYVYVISNIGSFGDDVLKIGMTRRLEPLDRVRELGDASVPFPFDVHMMISCDNAPSLENGLHRRFTKDRINRVNFRKEFFRVSLEDVAIAVGELHGQVDYVATPEALQFRESELMSDEEFEMVESTVGDLVDEPEVPDE